MLGYAYEKYGKTIMMPKSSNTPCNSKGKVLIVDDVGGHSDSIAKACQNIGEGVMSIAGENHAGAATALATAAMLGLGLPFGFGNNYVKTEAPMLKCGLPECENMSRKDYCCAEHCKLHRAMKKSKITS